MADETKKAQSGREAALRLIFRIWATNVGSLGIQFPMIIRPGGRRLPRGRGIPPEADTFLARQ